MKNLTSTLLSELIRLIVKERKSKTKRTSKINLWRSLAISEMNYFIRKTKQNEKNNSSN